jgi:hypothetical protein
LPFIVNFVDISGCLQKVNPFSGDDEAVKNGDDCRRKDSRDTGNDSEDDYQVDNAVQYRRYYCSYLSP